MSRRVTTRGVARPWSGRPPLHRRSTTSTRCRRSAPSDRSGTSTIPTTRAEARWSPAREEAARAQRSSRRRPSRDEVRGGHLHRGDGVLRRDRARLLVHVLRACGLGDAGRERLDGIRRRGLDLVALAPRRRAARGPGRCDDRRRCGAGRSVRDQLDLAVRRRPQRRGVRQRLRVRCLAGDGRRRRIGPLDPRLRRWKQGTRPSAASATRASRGWSRAGGRTRRRRRPRRCRRRRRCARGARASRRWRRRGHAAPCTAGTR